MNRPVTCPPSNPFSSRWVRPGAIPYLFPAPVSAQTLVERLRANGWWGQVVGPHGTGKSTLLASLWPAMEQAGRNLVRVALHDGQRWLPSELTQRIRDEPCVDRVLVIDGYEQLSYWSRFWVKRHCRRLGTGLLVTSHHSVGLPELYRTVVTAEAAQQVVSHLLSGRPEQVGPEEVTRQLAARSGNLREALFDLYDWYERRRE